MQAFALVGFEAHYRNTLGRGGRAVVLIAVLGWIGMAAGTAAEFWLFSDLPYGQNNHRNTAFTFFSVSSLVADLALLVLGIRIFLGKQLPRTLAAVMILCLPLDIGFFLAGHSIFLATTLTATTLAILVLLYPPLNE